MGKGDFADIDMANTAYFRKVPYAYGQEPFHGFIIGYRKAGSQTATH